MLTFFTSKISILVGDAESQKKTILLVAAGGNTSWSAVVPRHSSRPAVDQRSPPPGLSLLTTGLVEEQLGRVEAEEPLDQDLMQAMETIFSSLSCLNGSLLLPTHHSCRGNNPGVDLPAWSKAYSAISTCSHDSIPSLVIAGLLGVIQQLRPSPPDVETLR